MLLSHTFDKTLYIEDFVPKERFSNENYTKESDTEKRNIFLIFVLATLKTDKCRDLSNRPAVPLVA